MRLGNKLLAGLIACLSLASCSNEGLLEVDVAPISFLVSVSDASGTDLLNDNSAGSITNLPISATYNDETKELTDVKTRAYLAVFDGVRMYTYIDGKKYLYIGEFDAASNCSETVTLNIGSKSYELSFDNTIKYKINGGIKKTSRKYYLNGDKVYGPTSSPMGMIEVVY